MSNLAVWIHTPFAQALGWTLVHFIWEGAALAAVLMAALRVLRAEPAQRRYTFACLILAAMPVAFAVTLAVIWARRPIAIAVPMHWMAAPAATGPIEVPSPRFSWRGMLDRLAWLVPVWFAGVAFFYARGLAGWAAVRRLRVRGVCAPPTEWQTRLDELGARLRISRTVSLLESYFTDTPVLIGYLRPVILLPVGCLTGLSVAQVECILLHELAHVARHDYLVNLLQSLVEGLLFYHPAVWWVSNVVRAERENCCDDRVVELMGNARAYAATLAVLEERRAPQAALAANGGNLMKRIRRLTMESHGQQTSVAPAASAAVLLVIFAAALTALPAKLPSIQHARSLAPPRLVAFAAAAATPQESAAPIATPYKKWLNEDVVYIINDEERAAFLRLANDAEREDFIEKFWKRRDPSPDTEENEYREEHYRRIAYANEHFTGNIAGWKTDRGRTYIMYGPPDEIDDHSSGGSYQRPPEEGGGTVETYPFQQWRYRFIDGMGNNITLEFVDHSGTGEFRISTDPNEKVKTPYRQWLLEDVVYIVTPEERAAFQKLASDQEREQFIEQFWQRRGTAFREEHYRRIAYANEHFRSGVPGWKTDMGRIYIVYGPPDRVMDSFRPNIVWTYQNINGASVSCVFRDSEGNGEYRLWPEAQLIRPKEDDAVRVYPSNQGARVYLAATGRGQAPRPDLINSGDLLEVGLVATAGDLSLTSLDQTLDAKRAECAALENKYRSGHPEVLSCRVQMQLLEERAAEAANKDVPQALFQLKAQENSLNATTDASLLQLKVLEKRLAQSTNELKELGDRIAFSSAVIQKYTMLQSELSIAKDDYAHLSAEKGAKSSPAKQAKANIEAKESEIAAFSAANQRFMPQAYEAGVQRLQDLQSQVAELNRQISGERQKQALLKASLNNNKKLQGQLDATDIPAARQLETCVIVGSDGKIEVAGQGTFMAAGLTPAQLEAAIGASSSVRVARSAVQVVNWCLFPPRAPSTNTGR